MLATFSDVSVVVFLRGMNLGRRRINNDELVGMFTGAGYDDVSAYQASGNVILGAVDIADGRRISRTLATALGYDVGVFVRGGAHLARVAASSPIQGRTGAVGGRPQVVFLRSSSHVDVDSVFPPDHEVHQIGAELHWLPPTGLSQLGQLHRAMDETFGETTVRTLGTIERLAQRVR